MNTKINSKNTKVLILTGFSPVKLSQMEEMGIYSEALSLLFSMRGKDTFRFSVPPIGPAAIGSYLKYHDIEVAIADFYYDEIQSGNFDIVGISSTFMGLEDVRNIADLVRQQNPSATIVLGGPLSWSMPPAKLLEMVMNIDYIVRQEGEETFLKLINAIRHNNDRQLIEGIVFLDREKGCIVETPPRRPLNIEVLPLPAWDIMGIPSRKRLPILPVETSRGCPYHCAYCSEVTYWDKPVRYRSEARVISELRYNAQKFGITTFRFTDSCFSAPPERNARICDAIYEQCIKDGIPVKWSAYARIENLSPSLLDKMKRSGCVALDVGLESGSPIVLQRMNKNYNPEIAVIIAKAARESGIIINYNLIIGFPGETRKTIQSTTELIERSAPDTFACFVFLLMPNSTVYNQRHEFGIDGMRLSWKHATMTSEEAKEAVLKLTKEITSSSNFPGGEHFACYLTSLGFSQEEIRHFYHATASLVKDPNDEAARSMLGAMFTKTSNFY